MTQAELGDGLITASMVSQMESNRMIPSRDVMVALAERLQVDVSFFEESVQQKTLLRKSFRKARSLMEQGDHATALPILLKIVEEKALPDRTEAIYQDIANCYDQLDQMDKCADAWQNIVHLGLDRGDIAAAVHAYYMLGNAYRRHQSHALSRMYWERAAVILDRHPELYMPIAMKLYANLARVYFHFSEFTAAEHAYTLAERYARDLHANMERVMIVHGRSVVLLEQGKFSEAETATRQAMEDYEALQHMRGLNQCRVNLAVIYLRRGQVNEAITLLSDVIGNDQMRHDRHRLAKAYAVRAECLVELRRYEEALVDAGQVDSLPQDPHVEATVSHLRAICWSHLGDLDTALEYAKAAVEAADALQDIRMMVAARKTRRRTLMMNDQEAEAVAASLEMCQVATRFVRHPHEFVRVLPEK